MSCLTGVALIRAVAVGEQPDAAPASKTAWTLDDALNQLQLYPRDAYLQYVAMQLARNEGRQQAVFQTIGTQRTRGALTGRAGRSRDADLFSIFSGALAVQESLQLDTLQAPAEGAAAGGARPAAPIPVSQFINPTRAADAASFPARVPIRELRGPTIKSHPWSEMLAGRKPNISPLARCVPDDFYYVEFRSLNKLLALMDAGDLWGTHLFSQTVQESHSHGVAERIERQLAVETHELLRRFYDLVVEEVAVTGSDLFVREGSDVTMIFRYRQEGPFRAMMDVFQRRARDNSADVKQETGTYRDVPYEHLTSPDRRVHVYAAYPADNVHVRSNSRQAFERVIDTIKQQGNAAAQGRALGDTEEFAYIRTLMPYGAENEDGFVYLSDPFIRRMVGPQVKLSERRRLVCYNHLRMIGHATAMHETQLARLPASLQELAANGCAPGVYGEGKLVCPNGGGYSLAEGGRVGVCSVHGRAAELVPCLETPLADVTGEEAAAYSEFVRQYNQYWRTFFDPIALRIKLTEKQYQIETIVLPLIDNTIYTGLAHVLGGPPEPLDPSPAYEKRIFSVALKLNKQQLLEDMGWQPPPPSDGRLADTQRRTEIERDAVASSANLKRIALAMFNYESARRSFPPVANFDEQGKPLLSWRVHMLPYIEQGALYEQFHLDEPWDSEHNKTLIERMPEVFNSPGRAAAKPGTTTYVVPTGAATAFTGAKDGMRLGQISDGTSNTLLIVDASEEHAVPWTKPADLPVETADLRAAILGRFAELGGLAAFCDGSVQRLLPATDANVLQAFVTRAGREIVNRGQAAVAVQQQRRRSFMLNELLGPFPLDEHLLYDFVTKGIGNQIGLHVCDGDPLFDFQLVWALGQSLGSFSGRGGLGIGGEMLPLTFLAASFNSPVYVTVPLKDVAIADVFLIHLDEMVVKATRQLPENGFLPLETDFYKLPVVGGLEARSFGIQFGPLKWRFFWARIDETLVIASKPTILADLAKTAAVAAIEEPSSDPPGPSADALLRIQAEHWDQVLASYRLGWAERHRMSCLNNIGPLSSMARLTSAALPTPEPAGGQKTNVNALITTAARRVYGVAFFCPEGGKYVVSDNGKHVTCSIHGSAAEPTQSAAPEGDGAIDGLLRDFSALDAKLTFLEDGLHAVLTIDRGR